MASASGAVSFMQHVGSTGITNKAFLPPSLSTCKIKVSSKRSVRNGLGYNWCGTAGISAQNLPIRAVLEKPSSGDQNLADPARATLEKLYHQKSGSAVSPPQSEKNSIDLAVSTLHHNDAIQDLKKKEQELKQAQEVAKKDGKEVQSAQSALVNGEKNLELASYEHKARQEEIALLKKRVAAQSKELKETNRMVKLLQRDVGLLQDQLSKKQEELKSLKAKLQEKDQVLSEVRLEIRSRESQLLVAHSVISQQAADIDKLKGWIKDQENEFRRTEEDRFSKQEKLQKAESELEKRTVAYLNAREELKDLSRDAELHKSRGLAFERELDQTKLLLADVRKELTMSQKVIADYRLELEENEVQNRRQHEELTSQHLLLNSYIANLQSAKTDYEKEKEHVKLLKESFAQLEQMLQENKSFVKDLQLQLDNEKAALRSSVSEVNSLRKQLQQQESALSDNQLSLHLKGAELVSLKLEMQGILSDLTSTRCVLDERGQDLQSAKKMVDELQQEVNHLRARLKLEEDKHTSATLLLKERDRQLDVMKLDANRNKLKLSEATTVIEEIAKLSRFLAGSDGGDRSGLAQEGSVLMETNSELFSANRALLEKEIKLQQLHEISSQERSKRQEIEVQLDDLKDRLQHKDAELQAVHRELANKDAVFKQLQTKWQARESELKKMREDVIEEARGLTTLHVLAQTPGRYGGKCPGAVAVEKLELEAAKLELEAAKCALQKLSDLSFELLEGGSDYGSSHFNANDTAESSLGRNTESRQGDRDNSRGIGKNNSSGSVFSEVVADLDNLKMRLEDRDETIELTKRAMANLSKMTRELMMEAGVNIERPLNYPYSVELPLLACTNYEANEF